MSHKEAEDRIIHQIVSGNQKQINAAIETMCITYYGMVSAIVKGQNVTEIDKRIILHDAVIVLVQKLQNGSYDPSRAKMSTLLYRIAYNKWLDEFKKRKRTDKNYEKFKENDVSTHDHQVQSVEDDMIEREEQDLAQKVLSMLSPKCQDLFKQIYLHGQTIKSASDILGISEEAAKKRNQRCREKLSEILRNKSNGDR